MYNSLNFQNQIHLCNQDSGQEDTTLHLRRLPPAISGHYASPFLSLVTFGVNAVLTPDILD
jgi:hypothetical protein